MNKMSNFRALLFLITAVFLMIIHCAGGFKSDSPNAPQFEDSIFGSDSSR